jgi:hypothetical protein
VERRGRMVRTSASQPEGRGFESRRGICEHDTLKSTARGSQNKKTCLRTPNLSKKKKKKEKKKEKKALPCGKDDD